MYPTIRVKWQFVFILVAALILNSLPARAEIKPKTKCNIRIDNAHLSKSIEREFGFNAVKINARSKCNLDMSNLQLTVEIYKKGFFRNHFIKSETINKIGLIPAEFPVKNNGTWARCKNSRPTRFFGVAYAIALVAGKRVHTDKAISESVITLPCGT